MADYELIGLNEAAPDLRAPTAADRGVVVGGVLVEGLAELDGGADINGSRVATVADTAPLRQAVRVAMTAAASGGNGIQAPDNDNLDMGTNNFTLHWEGSLPDWTPAAIQTLLFKYQSSVGVELSVRSPLGLAQLIINTSTTLSTVPISLTDASLGKITVVVVRESASVDGSITFYVNGVQLGSPAVRAAASPATVSTGSALFIGGTNVARTASDTTNAIIYNRALSAAEVLSLCVNGPALADLGASQVPIKTFDFSAGADGFTGGNATVTGNIDGIGGVDNTLRTVATGTSFVRAILSLDVSRITRSKIRVYMPASNVTAKGVSIIFLTSGSVPVAGGPTVQLLPDTWTEITQEITGSGSQNQWTLYMVTAAGAQTGITIGDTMYIESGGVVTQIGITGQWSAEDAQSNTGQIFDSSGNKNHALLPAAGATIIGRPTAQPQQVRWTNTWAGTNELQYIGGVNQAILPAKAYIESIVGVITGATVEDIIIGDGSDTDRYVTITTGLAAGTTTFTLANRTTDGTNLKLTVDPDANATMSIAWTITYRTLE